MTFDEAVTVIRKDIEEENNWRSARQKMQETLNAALEARHEVQQLAAKRAELTALTNQQAAVQRMIEDRQLQLTGFEADLAVKEQRAQQRLDELDAQIQTKETKLAVAEKRLDDLKNHLHSSVN